MVKSDIFRPTRRHRAMKFNRRWFTRINYQGKVDVKTPDGFVITAPVKDLSMKGIYVITDEVIPVGRSVEIFFGVSDDIFSEKRLSVSGRIARIDGNGFAVEFEKMDLQTFCYIKALVFRSIGKAAVIREMARFLSSSQK